MRNLYLIGFMGAGKTVVGRLVAGRLAMPFVDLDALIEEREGTCVSDLFAQRGEDGFRHAESEALCALLDGSPSVVACGGGVVVSDENRAVLRASGTVVLLEVSAKEALARIGDTGGRPLLAGEGAALADTLLAARSTLYRATADFIVDTAGRTPKEVALLVSDVLGERFTVRCTP